MRSTWKIRAGGAVGSGSGDRVFRAAREKTTGCSPPSCVARNLLNPLCDGIPMDRSLRRHLQYQQVERPSARPGKYPTQKKFASVSGFATPWRVVVKGRNTASGKAVFVTRKRTVGSVRTPAGQESRFAGVKYLIEKKLLEGLMNHVRLVADFWGELVRTAFSKSRQSAAGQRPAHPANKTSSHTGQRKEEELETVCCGAGQYFRVSARRNIRLDQPVASTRLAGTTEPVESPKATRPLPVELPEFNRCGCWPAFQNRTCGASE